MPSVLFVCLGNICRSPAAEGMTRAARPDWTVDSAGTGAWHIGKPPYPPMIAACAARGCDLGRLRARKVSPSDFNSFDLIIAMDRANSRDIERLRPKGATTPVRLLSDFGAAQQADMPADVPDPYYTDDFDATLDMIEACLPGLFTALDSAG